MQKPSKSNEKKEQQRQARKQAKQDPVLREQAKTETEARPYLDTEGGE